MLTPSPRITLEENLPLRIDGNFVAVGNVNIAKALTGYFSSEHGLNAGFNMELDLSLLLQDTNDMQITEDPFCLHLRKIYTLANRLAQMGVAQLFQRLWPIILAGRSVRCTRWLCSRDICRMAVNWLR